jgi:hypothetical protein
MGSVCIRYNTVMKDINDSLLTWRNGLSSKIGKLDIVEISFLPNLIWNFKAIPIKLSENCL